MIARRDVLGRALTNFLELHRGATPTELADRFAALPRDARAAAFAQLLAALETPEGE